MKPDVSIIVPLYNQGEFLGECIDSVLEQTHENWECIIVNDASTDNSLEIAMEIAKLDKRIKLVCNWENRGLAATRNVGIQVYSKADHILPLDADDVIAPIMLERTLDCIKRKLGSIIYTDYYEFGEGDGWSTGHDYNYENLLKFNHITGCALYLKRIWEDVGGYDEFLTRGLEDWNFWLKAGYLGYYAYHLKEFLFMYRIKKESMFKECLKDFDNISRHMMESFDRFKLHVGDR